MLSKIQENAKMKQFIEQLQ